jgi:hypothetical protein
MEFIKIILENSNLKEAKLYNAARKAASNPEIGITIENKAAYFVIRDCANITLNYLPHFVFGSYQNPFESLKGKFKREVIAEFIKQSETSLPHNQLLHAIIAQAEKMKIISAQPSTTRKLDFASESSSNPYGEYGSDTEINLSSKDAPVTPLEILCTVFGVS